MAAAVGSSGLLLCGGGARLKCGATHDLLLRAAAGELAAELSLAHDEDAVGYLEELRHFRADHQDGGAASGEFIHHFEDFRFGANVYSARGLIEEENACASHQPLGDGHFLLIAATEPARQLLSGRSTNAEARGVIGGDRALGGMVE